MAKGYWIARVDVFDVENYKAYLAGLPGRRQAATAGLNR